MAIDTPRRRFSPRPLGSSIPRAQYLPFQADRFSARASAQTREIAAQLFERDALAQIERQQAGEPQGFELRHDTPVLGGLLTNPAVHTVMDLLSRPSTAVSGAALGAQGDRRAGGDFWEGMRRGFTGSLEERADFNFASVLENAGWGHEGIRNVVGFALDATLTPENLLLFGVVNRPLTTALRAGGRAARAGAGASVGRVPLPRGRSIGQVSEQAADAVYGVYAKGFTRRLAGSDVTEGQLRRLMRNSPERIDPKAGEELLTLTRRITNLQRLVMPQVARDLRHMIGQAGIPDEVVDVLRGPVDPTTGLPQGNAEAAKLFRELRRTSWDEAEVSIAEGLATPGRLTPQGLEEQLARTGAAGLRRLLQSEYELGTKIVDDFRSANSAAWADFAGVPPVDGFYWPSLAPTPADVGRRINETPGLKDPFLRFAQKFHQGLDPDELIRRGLVETDVFAAIATDMAQKRYLSVIARLFQDDLLQGLGVRTINPTDLQTALNTLARAGLTRPALQPGLDAIAAGARTRDDVLRELREHITSEVLDPEQQARTLAAAERVVADTLGLGESRTGVGEAVTKYIQESLETPAAVDDGGLRQQVMTALLGEVADAATPTKPTTWTRAGNELVGPEEVIRVFATFNDVTRLGGFMSALNTIHALWKPLATAMGSPAYYGRNLAGLMSLGIAGGLRPDHMIRYGIDAAQIQRNPVGHGPIKAAYSPAARRRAAREGRELPEAFEMDATAFLRELELEGATMGGFREAPLIDDSARGWVHDRVRHLTGQASPQKLSNEAMKAVMAREGQRLFRTNGFNPFRWARTMPEAMDNNFKIGGALARIVEHGDTFEEAAAWARKWYFNYHEVGPFTDAVAGVVPFARWLRLNLGAQLETLIHKPHLLGKHSLATRPRSSEAERQIAEAGSLPDWFHERLGTVLGLEGDGALSVIYSYGMPVEDLNRVWAGGLGDTAQNVLADITPILRIPIEGWALDKSVFTGERISNPAYQNFYARAYAWADKAPILKQWLDVHREEINGRVYYRSGEPARMYQLAALIGRPLGTVDGVVKAVEGRWVTGYDSPEIMDIGLGVTNALTGLKMTRIFPEQAPGEPLQDALARQPWLRTLLDRYREIPLYSGLSAADGNDAARAKAGIDRLRRLLYSIDGSWENDPDGAFRRAAQVYARRSGDDAGARLALRVQFDGTVRLTGREARRQFRRRVAGGALERAMLEATPLELDALEGVSR